jgi:hypothetical protein
MKNIKHVALTGSDLKKKYRETNYEAGKTTRHKYKIKMEDVSEEVCGGM